MAQSVSAAHARHDPNCISQLGCVRTLCWYLRKGSLCAGSGTLYGTRWLVRFFTYIRLRLLCLSCPVQCVPYGFYEFVEVVQLYTVRYVAYFYFVIIA